MKRVFDVYFNEFRVGHLYEADTDYISFKFNKDYLQMVERPVLSQSFEDDLNKIYTGKKANYLPTFFSNLIPEEGALREIIEKDLPEKDDLSVLEKVGLDLPGAVTVKPSTEESPDIDEEISVDNHSNENTGENFVLRFSLAGVQLKFSINKTHGKLALPAYGQGGEWIVKIESTRFPNLVENEYVVMEWARASSFDVPECRIEPLENLDAELQKFAAPESNVFVIKRYDRVDGVRIHQEDFTQVTNSLPKHKYDNITYEKLGLIISQIIDDEAFYEFVRRLVFMVASANNDLHLKNWSLIYPDNMSAQLSPLYDQVFSLAWEGMDPTTALKFAGVTALKQIDEEAFKRLAQKSKMDINKTIKIVRESLEEIQRAWQSLEARGNFPVEHEKKLQQYWSTANLLKKYSPLS